MGFYTDERIDFINSLLLATGYWQKMFRLQRGEAWKGNKYQKTFEAMMKSHQLHAFYPILKSISDMNPPASAFLQMMLFLTDDCKKTLDDVDIYELIPPQLDAEEFLRAIADLKLKYQYSVRVQQTEEERKRLCKRADEAFRMEDAKYLIEETFPMSKESAEPELVLSPLSTGNFIFNAAEKNYIIVSPVAKDDEAEPWTFANRYNMHARYYQLKLESSLEADTEQFVHIMNKGERRFADKAYSAKSGLDDREALKASVRNALSAYLIEEESSEEQAQQILTTAKKRGLSLVGAAYDIAKRTFEESKDSTFRKELFYPQLVSFIEKSL